jgi:hypothetical protein
MERLEHYRQCIRKLLTEHATLFDSNSDIECQRQTNNWEQNRRNR